MKHMKENWPTSITTDENVGISAVHCFENAQVDNRLADNTFTLNKITVNYHYKFLKVLMPNINRLKNPALILAFYCYKLKNHILIKYNLS